MEDRLQIVCAHCDAVNRLPTARDPKAGKCGRCGKPLFEGKPADLSTERFRRHVASSDIPVVVDFWASWCGPCRAMAPIFEKAAAELEPRARFVKVDSDAEPQLAAQYGVRGIPALFLIKNGKVVANHSGVAQPDLFRRWLPVDAAA
jgi:thioredoxin 2